MDLRMARSENGEDYEKNPDDNAHPAHRAAIARFCPSSVCHEARYAELMAFTSTPRALSVAGDALLVWDDLSRPLVNNAGSLGDRPLVVLSVTEQPRRGEHLTELQAEQPAHHSSRGLSRGSAVPAGICAFRNRGHSSGSRGPARRQAVGATGVA